MARSHKIVATGNGFWVENNGVLLQVIDQNGNLLIDAHSSSPSTSVSTSPSTSVSTSPSTSVSSSRSTSISSSRSSSPSAS